MSASPQANGELERLNQEISCYLNNQLKWSDFLQWTEYAQNSLTHSFTGLIPSSVLWGSNYPCSLVQVNPHGPGVDDWVRRSDMVWDSAQVRLQRTIWTQKIQANHRRTNYQPGQSV